MQSCAWRAVSAAILGGGGLLRVSVALRIAIPDGFLGNRGYGGSANLRKVVNFEQPGLIERSTNKLRFPGRFALKEEHAKALLSCINRYPSIQERGSFSSRSLDLRVVINP